MIEFVSGFISRIFGWLLPAGWKYALKRWSRPVIEHRKAPSNFFDHIFPGVSKDRVKEILGSPHRVFQDKYWAYRFKDALVQIEYWDGGGAKSIAIALTIHSPKSGFKHPMLDVPLGKMSLADAMQDEGELKYRSSLRSEEIVWVTRIGVPGAWNNYTFGALLPLTPGVLDETSFTWDSDKDQLISNAKDVHINWIAVSGSMDEVFFDWVLGLPGV